MIFRLDKFYAPSSPIGLFFRQNVLGDIFTRQVQTFLIHKIFFLNFTYSEKAIEFRKISHLVLA